jgi:lipopolysaccharide export system protein LptA
MTQFKAAWELVAAGSATALASATIFFVGGPAFAQSDTRSKAPIDITADQAEVSNARCVAIWRGSAEAVQDKTRIRADVLTVYSRSKGAASDGRPACGGADRIEADGHVYYVSADQNARGDHAVYSQSKDQIVLTGDVVVVQGQNVARGDRLTITISTHEATMASNTAGAGKPGRVRAVFYPDNTDQADSPAKP